MRRSNVFNDILLEGQQEAHHWGLYISPGHKLSAQNVAYYLIIKLVAGT